MQIQPSLAKTLNANMKQLLFNLIALWNQIWKLIFQKIMCAGWKGDTKAEEIKRNAKNENAKNKVN